MTLAFLLDGPPAWRTALAASPARTATTAAPLQPSSDYSAALNTQIGRGPKVTSLEQRAQALLAQASHTATGRGEQSGCSAHNAQVTSLDAQIQRTTQGQLLPNGHRRRSPLS